MSLDICPDNRREMSKGDFGEFCTRVGILNETWECAIDGSNHRRRVVSYEYDTRSTSWVTGVCTWVSGRGQHERVSRKEHTISLLPKDSGLHKDQGENAYKRVLGIRRWLCALELVFRARVIFRGYSAKSLTIPIRTRSVSSVAEFLVVE